jgi:uncharacterized protein Smg (DUF494 family)
MTIDQLLDRREEIAMELIEAEGYQRRQLEQELIWIEELINEQEDQYGEENE